MINAAGLTTKQFANTADFEAYIRRTDYEVIRKLCFGVTVESSTGGDYQYQIRANISLNE